MESLIIFILVVITIVILKLMLGSNKKIIMKIANNEKLNNIVQKLPENIDICKVILKKLRNEKVKIEEQENYKKELVAEKDNVNSKEYIEQMAREKLERMVGKMPLYGKSGNKRQRKRE